jgi:hypothetical protein
MTSSVEERRAVDRGGNLRPGVAVGALQHPHEFQENLAADKAPRAVVEALEDLGGQA